jgi:para-nitrobenzyl esterase
VRAVTDTRRPGQRDDLRGVRWRPGRHAPGGFPGAAHTKEPSYLFHQSELTPAQQQISDTMIRYWTNFAAHGDPNGAGLPPWPAYEPGGQQVMTFGADTVSADGGLHDRAQCGFWAEQGFVTP